MSLFDSHVHNNERRFGQHTHIDNSVCEREYIRGENETKRRAGGRERIDFRPSSSPASLCLLIFYELASLSPVASLSNTSFLQREEPRGGIRPPPT